MSIDKNGGLSLIGRTISLSPLLPDADLNKYLEWVNDSGLTRYMEVGKNPVTEMELKEYIAGYNDRESEFLFGIVRRDSGKHIGNITLHQINQRNRFGEIGIFIGDRESQGRGFGLEALLLVMEFAFIELHLHKLCAGAVAGNIGSQKLFTKAGFSLEATLREQFYLDGDYHDCYRYGILRKEFQTVEHRQR